MLLPVESSCVHLGIPDQKPFESFYVANRTHDGKHIGRLYLIQTLLWYVRIIVILDTYNIHNIF